MSHIETASTQIREIDALAAAVARYHEQGARFNRNVTQFTSYIGTNTCAHSITVEGVKYGIGVVPSRQEAGAYDLAFDGYGWDTSDTHDGHKLTGIFGNKLAGLTNAYAAEYVSAEARRNGYTVSETVAEDGAIVITANSY